jgi:hypothetical protein
VCVRVADEQHVEKRKEAVQRIKSAWSERAISDSAQTFKVEVVLHSPEKFPTRAAEGVQDVDEERERERERGGGWTWSGLTRRR